MTEDEQILYNFLILLKGKYPGNELTAYAIYQMFSPMTRKDFTMQSLKAQLYSLVYKGFVEEKLHERPDGDIRPLPYERFRVLDSRDIVTKKLHESR